MTEEVDYVVICHREGEMMTKNIGTTTNQE